ncbi:sugar kinase [Alicyclobacillus fastidiosus]|uniref:Sugar kinase n=1 Tax=Alicyclobacillus fastidiosus TaxID=392011 RepID=A0ABY6ZGL7_9BACL|nr:sugar kinase [Alicyclobacillus fastidiosus]WAH41270.1 sugar kinase [Alicyclobacillus fastidiosus]GMA62866.1 2-dehydro-3-deoxygluconokinase [Alicyclobacillus fastidiosus]
MKLTDKPAALPSVLTFGEPLVVLVPDAEGQISTTHQLRPYAAGAELNTAVGLARLGINASFACSVGTDPLGQIILHSGRAEGVDMRYVQQDASAPTGMFFKQWSGLQGRTSVYYYRSTSSMAVGGWNPVDVQNELQAGTWSWVHSTGITWMIGADSRQAATELFELCHTLDIPISFDVNVRLKLGNVEQWRECVKQVLPYITWFLLGDEEAQLLFGTDEVIVIEEYIRKHGFAGQGVMLKLGERGAAGSVAGVKTEVPVWPVTRVVDTVGAGDGFNAGWLAGMLRGWSIEESMRLGSLVGAFAVTSMGDYAGYPSWSEVVQELSGRGNVAR